MPSYAFDTKDGYTVEIAVVGSYRDSDAKDIVVCYAKDTPSGHVGNDRYFEETDDEAEIFQWLIDEGLEFVSYSSLRFNMNYVGSVLICEEWTEDELLDVATSYNEGESRAFLSRFLDLGGCVK